MLCMYTINLNFPCFFSGFDITVYGESCQLDYNIAVLCFASFILKRATDRCDNNDIERKILYLC